MTEPPIETLQRWEDQGAVWRATLVSDTFAVVELCACTGERVDELRSGDPALIRYLMRRPSSESE